MNERLLQYIWQFQYFSTGDLCTEAGESIRVLHPGIWNKDQGPDFSNAKIRIGNTVWAGAVELHLRNSDWFRHRHQGDTNYSNVILHVVWEKDNKPGPAGIPLLVLGGRVPRVLLEKYKALLQQAVFIPCEKQVATVPALHWQSWQERLLAERLLRKAGQVKDLLRQNNFHWEETAWWMLARYMGLRVNADSFEAIARSVSLRMIADCRHSLLLVEALLLGQAGLLNQSFTERYPKELQTAYRHLQHKYRLQPVNRPLNFLRMRPVNFPTIRLAQLAVLLQGTQQLFATITAAEEADATRQLLMVKAGDYWDNHYRLEQLSPLAEKRIGHDMADMLLINTLVPLLFAWGDYHQHQHAKEKALRWLLSIRAENNSIIRSWEKAGICPQNSFESQSLLELHQSYCMEKRCLECGVGANIIR